MEPKYEFAGETKKRGDSTLYRIRRLSDGNNNKYVEELQNLLKTI